MGSKYTINYLRELWYKRKSDFLFLSDTKQDFAFVLGFQAHFDFDNLMVDPKGMSGGLALYYNNEYQIKILYSSNRMIDVEAVAFGKMSFSLLSMKILFKN